MPPKGDRCEFMHYDPKTIPWPHVHRCEQPAAEHVHVDGEDKDLCAGHVIEARQWEKEHDWLGVKGITVGSDGLSLDKLMQADYNARSNRRDTIDDIEWERIKMHPAHRSSLRIMRDELMQRAADGEFD